MKNKHSQPALTGFKYSALTLAISAALPISMANAEEITELATAKASAQTEESYKVDESTSVKYTQPLLDTAKSISVIPQSVMKDRNVDSLRDALRNVPGISMAAGEGGTPTGDSMSIRGFSTQNDIMIDSVRDIAGYTRDTYNVEAIEVAKGPGSAVYGRGATGGSINLQTKTAKLDEFADVSLRLGSESDHRAQLDVNKTLGATSALRVNVLSDAGDVAGRDEVNNATKAVALSFATGIGTDSRLSVNADFQTQDNLPDYGIPWVSNSATSDPVAELADSEGGAPPVEFSNFYGNVYRDFEDIKAQSLTVKYEKDLNASTTLRVLGRTGSVSRESVVTAPRFISLTTSTDVRLSDEKTRDTRDSLNVVQVDLLGQYQLGGVTHDIVAGFEMGKEKFERGVYDDNGTDNLDTTPELTDLYNPNPRVNYEGTYTSLGKDDKATGDTTSIYAFDTLTLNPNWEVSVGLRYDIFETEYYYDLSGDDPSVKVGTEDSQLSWNLGVVYKPAENGSVYFGAGNSFNPMAEDLTANTRTDSNMHNLDPEKTTSYEVGTKWELLDSKLFVSGALFRTDKTNALTDDPFFTADSEQSRYDTLNGHQRVDGLELSAVGQVSDQLSITAGYTFQKSEVLNAEGDDEADQEGNALPRTPEHSFSLWGRYDVNEKLAFGLGSQYLGERYNSTSTTGREKANDYQIFDLMVSYQISDAWAVQLNAENLTDESYIDQLGGGHFIPGDGRYVSVKTSFSF
ncbi:TonB-dependent receptor [Saccharophagus degradans]|uniref:TonB-dependent siderophore receptor n=1 Tax=Saccharophagus degradans TaxID=86304 RepID=A0AAW7X7R0_9GAMM|nr:TonB-dependent siderophore receptor [Saccharophagus degradans]MDO6422434.1 TonB-dependent siderophore receptor [Saccharophagus degradans]MDO6608026.1 TonB-dependent siderophore receptor [Saccharophagus degradans]